MDDEYRLTADWSKVEAKLELLVPVKKKPVARRGNRTANIEKLSNELKQHLLAARDHVWAVGALLPRPSMQDLGKLLGLEKYEVSRCMKDSDAQMLRYLWKIANNIKLIRDWKG